MPTTSWPGRCSKAAVTELSTPPDMATTIREPRGGDPSGGDPRGGDPAGGAISLTARASVALLEPCRLDGLEDFLIGLGGIIGEARQLLDPLPEIGEAQIDDIRVGMALLQLDGDIVDVGPAHVTCRASCCESPRAATR